MWGTQRALSAGPQPSRADELRYTRLLRTQDAYAPSAHLRGERGVRARSLLSSATSTLSLPPEAEAAAADAQDDAGGAPEGAPANDPAGAPSASHSTALVPVASEETEIAELHDLFNGVRQSPIACTVYARFRHSCENVAKGEAARREKAQRDQLRIEAARQRQEDAQERRARVRARDTGLARKLTTHTVKRAQQIREDRKAWEDVVVAAKVHHKESGVLRVLETKGNDARLDKLEEEAAEERRRQTSAMHSKAQREAEASFRISMEKLRHQKAEDMKVQNSSRLKRSLTDRSSRKAKAAEEKREFAASGRVQMSRQDDDFKQRALAAKQQATASRANAALARAAMFEQRKLEVARDAHVNAQRARAAKEQLLETNQEKRRHVFASRYVDRDSALTFERSEFKRLYAMDDVADAQIDEANARMLERIVAVEPRTDDFVDDAGFTYDAARADAVAKLASRRKLEAERITRDNNAHYERLRQLTSHEASESRIDRDLTDEPAYAARAKAAAASKARRDAAAAALERKNSEMRTRLGKAKSDIDMDISDEAAGASRADVAAASRARKAAAAERLAADNRAKRAGVAAAVSKTDVDLTDEEGWQQRGTFAAASHARMAAEEEKLARENTDYRSRVDAAFSSIDTDISDEAAGAVIAGKAVIDVNNRAWAASQSADK